MWSPLFRWVLGTTVIAGATVGWADEAAPVWQVHGLVQADARWFAEEAAGEMHQALMRRIRPTLDLRFGDRLTARFTPELAPASRGVFDAFVTWRAGESLSLVAGKMKDPTDGERQRSARDLWFVERAYPSVLAPSRDVGLLLRGRVRTDLRYELGVFEGAADNGSSSTDTDHRKELVGRLEWTARPGLVLALAGGGGDRSGGAPAGYRSQAQRRFFRWRGGTMLDGPAWRLEPQFRFTRGRLELAGAWIRSQQSLRRGAVVADAANDGWYLAAHYTLAAGESDWSLAVRLSGLRIDRRVFPALADPVTNARGVLSATVGVNGWLNPHLKWAANLERSTFSSASAAASHPAETAFLTRLQFHF